MDSVCIVSEPSAQLAHPDSSPPHSTVPASFSTPCSGHTCFGGLPDTCCMHRKALALLLAHAHQCATTMRMEAIAQWWNTCFPFRRQFNQVLKGPQKAGVGTQSTAPCQCCGALAKEKAPAGLLVQFCQNQKWRVMVLFKGMSQINAGLHLLCSCK